MAYALLIVAFLSLLAALLALSVYLATEAT